MQQRNPRQTRAFRGNDTHGRIPGEKAFPINKAQEPGVWPGQGIKLTLGGSPSGRKKSA